MVAPVLAAEGCGQFLVAHLDEGSRSARFWLSGEMPAGIEAQTEQVFDNLTSVLGGRDEPRPRGEGQC